MNAIFKRISVRKYEDRIVEPDKVEKLLRAGMAAPSAKNQQPWEFYVVTNKAVLEQLSECSPYAGFMKRAPLAIVPCFKKNDLTMPMYAHVDMSACVENILLEAVELDLGATWIGVCPNEANMIKTREVLNIPEHLEPFAILAIGYPLKMYPQQDRYDESRVYYVK